MISTIDESTHELEHTNFKLLGELVFSPHTRGGETFYHIEVPSKGNFYRIGYAEYVFISFLTGQYSVAQALTLSARQLRENALTKEQGVRITQWLINAGLVTGHGDRKTSRQRKEEQQKKRSKIRQAMNPFWSKVSFGSPDRLIQLLTTLFGWLFSPVATILGIGVILVGAITAISRWDQIASHAPNVMTSGNWFWLALAWLILKLVHEAAHAVCCHRYGGQVRDTGVIFILLAPMAYVDATSCWRFPSKWRRIHVAAAGMYVELIIASLCVFALTQNHSAALNHFYFNVLLMASVSTIVFNANPLMRFDGYYILSDLIEIPNLATSGNRFVQRFSKWLFFGITSDEPREVGTRHWLICGYGILALLWRLVICVSLIAAASVLLHGWGILLSIVGCILWLGFPLAKAVNELFCQLQLSRVRFVRAVFVAGILSSSIYLLFAHAPWPVQATAPGIVEYSNRSVVRCLAPGFVKTLHVKNGQEVTTGQLLMVLENDDLRAKERELESELRQEEVRYKIAMTEQDAGSAQIILAKTDAIKERLADAQRRVLNLSVTATSDGKIICRNLKSIVGTYVDEGAELLAIGNEDQKELKIVIGQQEIDGMTPRVSEQLRFRIGDQTSQGTLKSIDPRATNAIMYAALSASAGGPLTVVANEEPSKQDESPEKLAEPRFHATIELSADVSRKLGAGQRGYVFVGWVNENMGEHLWLHTTQWIESVFLPQHR